MSTARRATLAVLGAALLFGTTGTSQALGPDGTTPLGLGTLRIAVGAVALWVLARAVPRPRSLGRDPWLHLLGAIGVAGYQPTFFTGTARCGVALGTVVALGSGPLFAGILEGLWLRRRPARSWWTATAVTVTGGALLVLAGGGGARADALGVLAALGAGLSYAVYALAAKGLIERGMSSTMALAWPFTLGAALLLPFAVVAQPLGWAATLGGAVLLAHLGVATVGVAYFLYGYGLRTLDTSTAVTLTLAEPLTAALLGVAVLGERLGALGWAGAALVVVGLAMAGGLFERAGRGRAGAQEPAALRS
ncbi:MAG: EamA family transporter [Acidimicrobiales bacterium]|nr:EamA family transporter [Acidimicrobiales bacterium]